MSSKYEGQVQACPLMFFLKFLLHTSLSGSIMGKY